VHLTALVRQAQFASPAQEALLNVIATQSWVTSELAATLSPHGITPAQYNVLRILRGAHPHPATCTAIAERLLDRTPDVTRLLERLEREELITRCRAEHDRRVVEVSITDLGLALVNGLDAPMDATVDRLTRHLSSDELCTLSHLLDRLRADQT
jgi:DNA-binding MarR family transcriptional regulator